MKESKHDRFKRIATKRTNEILEKIRILGNCADRKNYEYTDEDIEKMFTEINKQLKVIRSKFIGKKRTQFQL